MVSKKKFKISNHIVLKLEGSKTVIFVNGERFSQCAQLVLQIPLEGIKEYNEINSVDEASRVHQTLYENNLVENDQILKKSKQIHSISPEQEFWGHCSNLQAWYEYNYDTRLLHSSLSFPLLKKLADIGDKKASAMLKREIIDRMIDGNGSILKTLKESKLIPGYPGASPYLELKDFTKEDIVKIVVHGNYGMIHYLIEQDLIKLLNRREFFMSLLGWRRDIEEQVGFLIKTEKFGGFKFFFASNLLNSDSNQIIVKNQRIIGLSIAHLRLKEVPKPILFLRDLRDLRLNCCNLKRFPSIVTELDLRHLELGGNQIESVPPEIEKMKNLEYLELDENSIYDLSPNLLNLENLKYLNLDSNPLNSDSKDIVKRLKDKDVIIN